MICSICTTHANIGKLHEPKDLHENNFSLDEKTIT